MADWDETQVLFSTQNIVHDEEEKDELPLKSMRRHFREFYRNYVLQNTYVYREQLIHMHRKQEQSITVNVSDLGEYDAMLSGYLMEHPATVLPVMEWAAQDALDSLLYERHRTDPDDGPADTTATTNDASAKPTTSKIQVLLTGNLKPTALRSIKSSSMNKLLKCPGIVISTSTVKHRAVHLTVRCSRCSDTQVITPNDGPFGGIIFPRQCHTGNDDCPSFPYTSVPDHSVFCDQQTIKLQECPEKVPTGEMPRSVLCSVERSLVDRAPPGTRVSLLCVPSLLNNNNNNDQKQHQTVYLRIVGLMRENDAHNQNLHFGPDEVEAFVKLSTRSDLYDILSRSIAPTIKGSYTTNIKKSLLCQLFGGSRKILSDGVRLRGDINVLLLGDPSMAKSQFLKFISKVAPVGIYTSGKGSSAAGLTASVVRNAAGEFYLEGGAMVLADGGIVCIDEFDKMRPNDRVAIHEAMEQQTISISKAGITTVLNSRSSVLAAANPVFGRYDDFKSASENIDLMTTILSRFDLIFLVRDIRDEERDRMICQHVLGVHIENSNVTEEDNDENMASPEAIAENVMKVATTGEGELDVESMKKYIQYAKAKCSPRISEESSEVLTSAYVKIRDDVRAQHNSDESAVIPITVRQLEALVRLSESLAKMRIDSEVRPEDVTEALRLFKVSTMAASAADQTQTGGVPNREEMERTESFLRSRLVVNSMVNRQKLIEEAAGQGYNAFLLSRAISVMTGRGEILERNQGRLLKRIK